MTAPSAMTGEPCCTERIAPIANGIQAARCAPSRKTVVRLRGMTGQRVAGSAARSAAKVAGDPAFPVMFPYYPAGAFPVCAPGPAVVRGTCAEVVQADHAAAVGGQPLRQVRAEEAAPPGDDDRPRHHDEYLVSLRRVSQPDPGPTSLDPEIYREWRPAAATTGASRACCRPGRWAGRRA